MSNNKTKATIQLNPDDMLITFNTKLKETTNGSVALTRLVYESRMYTRLSR